MNLNTQIINPLIVGTSFLQQTNNCNQLDKQQQQSPSDLNDIIQQMDLTAVHRIFSKIRLHTDVQNKYLQNQKN